MDSHCRNVASLSTCSSSSWSVVGSVLSFLFGTRRALEQRAVYAVGSPFVKTVSNELAISPCEIDQPRHDFNVQFRLHVAYVGYVCGVVLLSSKFKLTKPFVITLCL